MLEQDNLKERIYQAVFDALDEIDSTFKVNDIDHDAQLITDSVFAVLSDIDDNDDLESTEDED